MFCLRSSVMVKPFHNMSTRLDFNSDSLAAQSIGLNSTSTPMCLAAALAMSMSKPTNSFLSSRKPIGGKLSSKPTTILLGTVSFAAAGALPSAGLSAAGAWLALPPQALNKTAETERVIKEVKIFCM